MPSVKAQQGSLWSPCRRTFSGGVSRELERRLGMVGPRRSAKTGPSTGGSAPCPGVSGTSSLEASLPVGRPFWRSKSGRGRVAMQRNNAQNACQQREPVANIGVIALGRTPILERPRGVSTGASAQKTEVRRDRPNYVVIARRSMRRPARSCLCRAALLLHSAYGEWTETRAP